MIALHGGLTTEMVYGMGGGFIGAAICFVYAHYKMYKTAYYNEEYIYFSTGRKLILYLGFLIVNLCLKRSYFGYSALLYFLFFANF